jgi:hypothetical protein
MQSNTDETPAPDPASPSRRSRTRRVIAVAAAALVCAAGAVIYVAMRGPADAGDEVVAHDGAYGYDASMPVGHTFTDGLTRLQIGNDARGPLRLISARPIEEGGGNLRVLGALARVIPDMLPPGYEWAGFQELPGFPPTDHNAKGAVPVNGLTVRAPKPGEYLDVQIQIGYQVMAPGRYTRRGVELIYEYDGRERRVVIPSRAAICAPANATCTPNDE